MVTPLIRKSLEKQGYKLIGSHSGVKLCRWTKVKIPTSIKAFLFCMFQSMLRGRGGCYKHTFYGIESHRCMETTPSLACANKCVFCWRLVISYWVSILCLTFRGLIDIIVIQWERPGNGKRMMPKLWFKEQSTIITKWSIPSKVYQVYYRVDWQKVRWYSSLVYRSMNSFR